MKKSLFMFILIVIIACSTNISSAQHVWCYSEGNRDFYVDTDEMYDMRPYLYVDVITIHRKSGEYLQTKQWMFTGDEGVMYYETKDSHGRLADNDLATEIYVTMLKYKKCFKMATKDNYKKPY